MKATQLPTMAIGLLLLTGRMSQAQTNPTPFNLETGGTYTMTNWPAASTAGTYPSNMAFHIMANTNPTLSSLPSGNVTGVYNDASTKTHMNGLDANGFSFFNSSTTPDISGYTSNRLGEAVLALNTLNRTSIQLSFISGEIGTATPVYAITCQYRIGTSGSWTSFSGAEYRSDNAASSVSFGPIPFPASLENQSVVQLRWVYNYVSGITTGTKPKLFVDNITVSSIPLVTMSPLPNTCSSAPAFVLSDGQPAGGIYSGPGVSGNNFNPAISGNGNFVITYTYTDSHGFSNSANSTISVDPSYCVTTTGLRPESCGATGLSMTSNIFCEPVYGATDYEYTFSNTSLGYSQVVQRGSNVWTLPLTMVPGLQYGQTYDVVVKSKVGGIWGAYTASCTISTMAFPSSQLTSTYCGATGLTLASNIYCTSVAGAQDYEFTFNEPSSGFTLVKAKGIATPNINLGNCTGVTYGKTYNVTVKAKVGGVWYPGTGPSCTITTTAFPTTQLTTASCGATNLMRTSAIYCNSVVGATKYEWTCTNTSLGFSSVKTTTGPGIVLANFTGILAGNTYDITVRPYAGANWGPSGTSCPITMSTSAIMTYNDLEAARAMDVDGSTTNVGTSFGMYPNPVSLNSILTIQLPSTQTVTVILMDAMGRKVYEKQYSDATSFEISLQDLNLTSGIYNLSLYNGESMQYQKLVVTK